MRTALIQRTTNETRISLELNLDGTGKSEIAPAWDFWTTC